MTQIKAHIPKIRFKEFSGEWEEKKLGEVCTSFSGGTPLTSNKEYYNGNIPFIKSGEINKSKTEQFITDLGLNNSSAKLVNKGDLLYALYGATSGQVGISKINGAINQAVLCIKTKENTFFLYTILKNKKDSILEKFLQGGQGNLSADIVKSFKFLFPSLPEQQKIASFLSSVDKKIEKIKEKKNLLEEYKKGVMQKIFSQELRFKDENGEEFGEWEEKKIGEIFDVTRGYVLAMTELKEKYDDFFKYPVYSSQTKNNGLAGYYNDFLYENAITWTTDGANAGDVKFRKGKFYCTNVCGVLLSKKGYANLCISELLNSVTHKYVSYVGNPKLMNNVMSNIILKIPSDIKEQEKIADFLSGIDEKIKKVSDALEKMEEFKKGLLQGIFV